MNHIVIIHTGFGIAWVPNVHHAIMPMTDLLLAIMFAATCAVALMTWLEYRKLWRYLSHHGRKQVKKFLIAAIVVGAAIVASQITQAGSRRCYFPEGQEYQHCYEGYDYNFWERDYRSRRDYDDYDRKDDR